MALGEKTGARQKSTEQRDSSGDMQIAQHENPIVSVMLAAIAIRESRKASAIAFQLE
jgi:hypothetical protein